MVGHSQIFQWSWSKPWQTLGIAWDQSQLQPVLVTITSSRALTRKVGHSVDSVGIRVDDLTLICVCHHCAPSSAAFLGFQRYLSSTSQVLSFCSLQLHCVQASESQCTCQSLQWIEMVIFVMFVAVCVSFVFLFCNICTILLCNAYLFTCCDPFLLEEAPMDVGTTVRMTVTVLPSVLFGCQDSGFLYSRIWEPKLPLCMHSVPCPCWKETLAASDSAISGCFRSRACWRKH